MKMKVMMSNFVHDMAEKRQLAFYRIYCSIIKSITTQQHGQTYTLIFSCTCPLPHLSSMIAAVSSSTFDDSQLGGKFQHHHYLGQSPQSIVQNTMPPVSESSNNKGNIHLYDDFLSKLHGSPNWPDDKEAVGVSYCNIDRHVCVCLPVWEQFG